MSLDYSGLTSDIEWVRLPWNVWSGVGYYSLNSLVIMRENVCSFGSKCLYFIERTPPLRESFRKISSGDVIVIIYCDISKTTFNWYGHQKKKKKRKE